MTEAIVFFPRIKGQSSHIFGLDKSFQDATADYLRRRWPQGTAKNAAREFGLSLDRAREAVRGRPSMTTVERIFKQGGLAVALPILEEVVGQSIAHHLRELRGVHEENGRRLAALAGDCGPVPDRRSFDPDCVGVREADRHQPRRRRVGEN
jgi:hypothetical protein